MEHHLRALPPAMEAVRFASLPGSASRGPVPSVNAAPFQVSRPWLPHNTLGLVTVQRHCMLTFKWVHSSVVRAADCRSAGPWIKSGCALVNFYHLDGHHC